MERLSKIKTETQKYEDDTDNFIQSVIAMQASRISDKTIKGNPCMCSDCPERPVFANEAEYFAHYQHVHQGAREGIAKSFFFCKTRGLFTISKLKTDFNPLL